MTTPVNPLIVVLRLLRHRTWLFVLNAGSWGAVHALPVVYGLVMKGMFDALSGAAPAGVSAWTFLALALGTDLVRLAAMAGGNYWAITYWLELVLLVRRNLLEHLLTAPGTRRLPDSPSEAVTRFRDDVEDLAEYAEGWIDFGGLAVFALISLTVMMLVSPLMTALILIPMILTVVLTSALRPYIRKVRRRMRQATGRVTDFIGEAFGGVQAIKVADREGPVLERFERLNEVRRTEALRDTLLGELFRSVTENMVNVGIGIVLLFAAAIRDGRFSVGDFALFVVYLPRLTSTMSFFGAMLVQHKRTGVAFERLQALLEDAEPEAVTADAELHLWGQPPTFGDRRPITAPLERLEVRDLSYQHPDGVAAIEGVTFEIERGSFTVITGRVGSGKSILLRVLLGLLPRDRGEILWNGDPIVDPATFLVPPRSAYTSQVPRLFSDSLRENVVMGRTTRGDRLGSALDLAVLRHDVDRLERGLDTLVGARGVKLSGGQVQRSAAARMFMRDADLQVIDDLSSALDVETEAHLWDGLFAPGGVTCLAVSHRRAALQRADRVIVMARGRVVAIGPLEQLLETSAELRELWHQDAADASPEVLA